MMMTVSLKVQRQAEALQLFEGGRCKRLKTIAFKLLFVTFRKTSNLMLRGVSGCSSAAFSNQVTFIWLTE